MFVKRFLLIKHDLNADRQNIKVLPHFVAQPFDGLQAHSILLCGDDALRRRQVAKCLVDQTDILLLELMVICEN